MKLNSINSRCWQRGVVWRTPRRKLPWRSAYLHDSPGRDRRGRNTAWLVTGWHSTAPQLAAANNKYRHSSSGNTEMDTENPRTNQWGFITPAGQGLCCSLDDLSSQTHTPCMEHLGGKTPRCAQLGRSTRGSPPWMTSRGVTAHRGFGIFGFALFHNTHFM